MTEEYENKGSLVAHNCFTTIKNMDSENIKVFIEPMIKSIFREIEKKIKQAILNGETKDYKFMELRTETNFYKEFT